MSRFRDLAVTGGHDFPRRERLRKRSAFQRVYTEGQKCVGPAFILFVLRREGQQRKFGCAVSQRIGNAVVRNRVKRYLREVYRTHRSDLPEDAQLVIVARRPAANFDFFECQAAVQQLFRRGGLLP